MKHYLLILLMPVLGSCSTNNNNAFNIVDFGAKGDSVTLCTKAIQRAIDAAEKKGGGTVIIPPGIYLSGTIFLKSNVTMEVQAEAKIFGSADTLDYVKMTWGHNADRQPYHLIVAKEAQNITICGSGTIDGNGHAFWKEWHSDSLPQWIRAKDTKISPMMEIQACKDVRIKDIKLLTGGGWTLHLYNSERVQVQGIKILNNLYAPNGDGIDISGCSDVTISDCIIRTCDDAICLKTMVDTRECKRITVTNCILECLCAALKIGNETFRDISQVTFSNCVIYGSSRAFAIYAESAGTISDITVSNIISDTKVPLLYNRPIHISLYLPDPGAGSRNGDWLFREGKQWNYEGRKPKLKNIIIHNFISTTDGRILITAGDGYMIENLILRDIILNYPWVENPIPYVDEVKSSQFAPVKKEAKTATAALVLENIQNLVAENIIVNWPESDTVPSEWQFRKKIANGTHTSFYPKYTKAVEKAFNGIYGRGLQGGYINTPLLSASDKNTLVYNIKNSTIKIYNK